MAQAASVRLACGACGTFLCRVRGTGGETRTKERGARRKGGTRMWKIRAPIVGVREICSEKSTCDHILSGLGQTAAEQANVVHTVYYASISRAYAAQTCSISSFLRGRGRGVAHVQDDAPAGGVEGGAEVRVLRDGGRAGGAALGVGRRAVANTWHTASGRDHANVAAAAPRNPRFPGRATCADG